MGSLKKADPVERALNALGGILCANCLHDRSDHSFYGYVPLCCVKSAPLKGWTCNCGVFKDPGIGQGESGHRRWYDGKSKTVSRTEMEKMVRRSKHGS